MAQIGDTVRRGRRAPASGLPDRAGTAEDREVVVGVLADPDLPTTVADRLNGTLAEMLAERVSDVAVRWRVEVVRDAFEALSGYERLLDRARHRVRTSDGDLAICLTDAPLRDAHGVVLAEVGADDTTAVISLPALGGVDLVRRTRRLIALLVEHLAVDVLAPGTARSPLREDPRLRRARTLHAVEPSDSDISCELVLSPRTGVLRLLLGMTRANRPWQLVWGLSAALGGALAGGAFGVFYSNIWSLADSLPAWRLAVVCVAAVVVYVVWLIAGHGLWQATTTSTRRDDARTTLRNAGTVLTVTAGALVFCAALFTVVLAASLLVITPSYLTSTIGHPAGFVDYLDVALVATVMGTIAGAVGSGLEDDTTIRHATYGYRERQRAEADADTR
ncbi:hypothetical protein [Pseudonocardia sp. KRD291]|uniref:hypothetical protein n=1 Tax=Pseudonocardia sp. KRD291 TaxID=2792007 RepID=UPI001C4A69DA|nr:hypothetical protein [Pseudonocardia sp. KRD291]MBW0105138.1 hypothetical protein [Pseudonocardia sp. KRD291]